MEEIKWFGHASFKIKGEKLVYIDPWKIKDDGKADIILVTHPHYDHFSSQDIMKISNEDTTLLIHPDCQSKLDKDFLGKICLVEANKKYNVKGVLIETIPAYNINKKFHPKENEWMGYLININGKRIYYVGDSDITPEAKNVKCDILIVPVSGIYTTNYKEAAELANIIKPRIAIPSHFGDIIGNESDAERFKELVKGVKVEILERD